MIQYIECSPPINMVDGIPASKAGEWPGIKSNKFPKTKKIIHIKKFNINSLNDYFSFPYNSRKKKIIPKKYEDIPIKLKTKRILTATYNNNLKTHKTYLDLYPAQLQKYKNSIFRREYDFEKKEKYHMMMKNSFDKRMMENGRKNNIGIHLKKKSDTIMGLTDHFYENVSNNKNLGVSLNHELYKKYVNKIENRRRFNSQIRNSNNKIKIKNMKNMNNNKKFLEILKKKNQLKYDIDYVASLYEKESTFLKTHI